MTSFADDNRKILKSRNRQYNINSSATESSASAKYVSAAGAGARPRARAVSKKCGAGAKIPNRSSKTNVRNGARRCAYSVKAPQGTFSAFLEQYKEYSKKRNEKIAAQNRIKIREAFVTGTNKAGYSYEEYTLSEHNFPVGLVAVVFAFTVVAVFLLLNYSQISKYNDRINELKSEMETYNEEAKELDILLEKKTDLSEIEKFALENGMVGSEQIESYYVSMADSYKIEKTEDTEKEYTVSTVMSGVIKLFSEALGN